MQLEQVLTESNNAIATVGEVRVLVERSSIDDAHSPYYRQSYWHHTHYPYGIRHAHIYGNVEDLLLDIYERDEGDYLEDGQLEQADWQPTTESIDLQSCRCRDCYKFFSGYGVIAESVSYEQWCVV